MASKASFVDNGHPECEDYKLGPVDPRSSRAQDLEDTYTAATDMPIQSDLNCDIVAVQAQEQPIDTARSSDQRHTANPVVEEQVSFANTDGNERSDDAQRAEDNESIFGLFLKDHPKGFHQGDLFFELLFAACLSVYTKNASLTSQESVGVFVGYIALLWWCWWSQVLFDVRYRRKDQVDRLAEALQMVLRCALAGVWIAFSTVASEFARNCTMLYVISRVLLAADYAVIIVREKRCPIELRDNDIKDATERHEKSMLTPIVCHSINMGANLLSSFLWLASWYVRSQHGFPSRILTLWFTGIATELLSQLLIELDFAQRSLAATPLVKRLALLFTVIFGNAFEIIGVTLNQISPSSRDWSFDKIPFRGWASISVTNAASSAFIVGLLFWDYYSHAPKKFDGIPAQMLLWGYLHFFLHVTMAVLGIGLGWFIEIGNTISALALFANEPQRHLPNTSAWQSYISDGFQKNFKSELPPVDSISDYYDRSTASIIIVMVAVDGVNIPNVDLATALVNSTNSIGIDSLKEGVKTKLKSYSALVESAQNPFSCVDLSHSAKSSVHWIYSCVVVILFVDVGLQLLHRHDVLRERTIDSAKTYTCIAIRMVFGVVVIILQAMHHATPLPDVKDKPFELALVKLAGILLLEAILQWSARNAAMTVHDWMRPPQPPNAAEGTGGRVTG